MKIEQRMRFVRRFLVEVIIFVLMVVGFPYSALGADPPALQGLSGQERERVAQLIEGARKEGGLMFLSHTMRAQDYNEMGKRFKEYYGLPNIEMKHAVMRSSQVVSRMSAEVKAGRYTVDVLHVGAPTFFDKLIEIGELARYESPEYKYYDPEVTTGTGAAAARPGYYISGMMTYMGIIYNTKFVKELKRWEDLLDPKYKGKIIVGDASKSTTYSHVYRGWRKILPRDSWPKLKKQNPVVILSSSTILTRVRSGEYWIGAFVSLRRVCKDWQRGVTHVKALHPDNRNVAIGAQMGVIKRAPHPSAARLWVDFFHKKESQEFLAPRMCYGVTRKDVKVPDAVGKVSPPVHKLNLVPVKWDIGADEMQKIRDEFRGIFLKK